MAETRHDLDPDHARAMGLSAQAWELFLTRSHGHNPAHDEALWRELEAVGLARFDGAWKVTSGRALADAMRTRWTALLQQLGEVQDFAVEARELEYAPMTRLASRLEPGLEWYDTNEAARERLYEVVEQSPATWGMHPLRIGLDTESDTQLSSEHFQSRREGSRAGRVIYDSAHSDFAGEYVESVRDPLEVTRVLPSVPFQLFMAPGSLVMLHPEPTLASSPGCVISHHPAMVDAAEWLFSVLWGQALPWTVLHPEAVHLAEDTMDPRLIGLLSAGEPDSAIARICGISERTVARQVAQLMVQVDAETRCELGFRLAERQLGWQRSAR